MKALSGPAMVGLLLSLILAGPPLAVASKDRDSAAPAGRSKRCLQLPLIRETEVIDDQTIIFHMSNRTAWKNRLPHRCPQLRIEDGFMYRTSIGKLCHVDVITVFNHGVTCGLGIFEPHGEADRKDSDENTGQSEPL